MLRVWAVTLVCLNAPLIFVIKPRLPVSDCQQPFSFDFLRGPSFWIYQFENTMESVGFFIPAIYLPSYARTIGLPLISGTTAVSLFNAASILGAVLLGRLVSFFTRMRPPYTRWVILARFTILPILPHDMTNPHKDILNIRNLPRPTKPTSQTPSSPPRSAPHCPSS